MSHTSRVLSGNKDIAPLVRELRPIAESGDPVAQFVLASLTGKSEPETAIALLRKSYEAGCVGAAGALGALVTKTAEARSWFIKAAEGGDASSQLVVASMNERGEGGFSKNRAAAAAWAKLSRMQAYNNGVALAADQYLVRLEPTLTAAETVEAQGILALLNRNHPKQPPYLCGQSAP